MFCYICQIKHCNSLLSLHSRIDTDSLQMYRFVWFALVFVRICKKRFKPQLVNLIAFPGLWQASDFKISVEIWILSEMNRRFWSWSCEAGADCPLVPYCHFYWVSNEVQEILNTYLDIIMSTPNTHLYTQLLRLYDQKTEKGQFFVQISTLLYAFKLSHTCEFSSKVLDILNILDIRY